MDKNAVNFPAQEINHEGSKEHVSYDQEEKINHEPSPDASQPSVACADKCPEPEKRDVEAVDTEVDDPEPVKVPRSKRRGLFGRFSIVAEVEEPKHYSRRIKWYITFVVALAAVAAPMGSAIIFRKMVPDEITFVRADFPSFTRSNCRRPAYVSHNHESLIRLVHAFYVNIPTLVVFILRDSRTTHDLPHIIHAVFTIQHPCSSITEYRHADCHADSWWRGSG